MTPTLPGLQARCSQCPDCDALWQWPGALQNGRYPIITIDGQQRYTRRVAYALANPGKALPAGRKRVISSSCNNPRCINPELLYVATKSAVLRKVAAQGHFSSKLFRAKVAAGMRPHSKLSDEAVLHIRASTESHAAVARQYKLSGRYVSLIRRGKNRIDYLANPFDGLMP